MTMTTTEQDMRIKLARECAAKACGEPQRVAILDGQFDRTPGVKSALLAIQATEDRMAAAVEAERERCARIAEEQELRWANQAGDYASGQRRASSAIAVTIRIRRQSND